jgi:serine protease
VRLRNRGGSVAANVEATVYWAPVSTLLTPDLWTLVGSTTIANVPTGNLLTVSDVVVWPAAEIPATGHYCFVALIGQAQDPAPAPADFLNWDNYRLFIRANNNVTWRNFNVVNNAPPSSTEPPNYVALPFLVAGAPDKGRRMHLEIVGRLPRDARVLLEMPQEWAQLLQVRPAPVKGAKNDRKVYIPVNPSGRTTFADVVFPAKARISMRLLVNVPEELRQHEFEIFARQVYENEEVGRVTWRLAPPRERE